MGQGVRWLGGAHLPALRHLGVIDGSGFRPEHSCVAALAAPRWFALEALQLCVRTSGSGTAALSTALAPTLRRLMVFEWPFGTEGCAEEWPQLRSLEVGDFMGSIAEELGPVRLPRPERMAVLQALEIFIESPAPSPMMGLGSLEGFAALRPSIPALRALELDWCFCAGGRCPVVGCTHPKTVELLAELRAAWPGLELQPRRPGDWTQA
jgi:hypothetical protein